jgi:hypothetical protein
VTGARPRRRPAAALVALTAALVAYLAAAWAVPPGFFDGLAPPGPYRWTSPPPQFKNGNQQPLAGHTTVNAGPNRQLQPGTASTGDRQAAVSWTATAFQAPAGASQATFEIQPVRTYPNPGDVTLRTNVYCFRSSARIAPNQQVLFTLTYSDGVPSPTAIYSYTEGGGQWKRLGSAGNSAPFTISVRSGELACFAGGTEKAQGGSSGLPGQSLPLLVAILIVLVLLAGLPLVVLRRRGRGRPDDDGEEAGQGDEDR